MAENKKSVLLYCDIISTVRKLSNENAGLLFKHYLAYINDENPEAPNEIVDLVFEPIKQNLKRDLKKWEDILEKRSKAGSASADKRRQNATNPTRVESVKQDSTNSTVIDNVNVNVNDTVNVKDIFSKENNLPKTFFYLNLELIKTPLSVWLKEKKQIDIETWCMQNNADMNKVFDEIDKDVGKTINDEDHAFNFFKSTARQLKKEKSFAKKEPTQSTNFNQAKDYKL